MVDLPDLNHDAIRGNLTLDLAWWQNPGFRRSLSWYCDKAGGRTDTNINACFAAGAGTVIWDFDHTSTGLITVPAGVAVVDPTGTFSLTVGASLARAVLLNSASKWTVNILDPGKLVSDRVIATGAGALTGPCIVDGSGFNGIRCETGGAGATNVIGTQVLNCANIGIAITTASQSIHIRVDRCKFTGNVKSDILAAIDSDKTVELYLCDTGEPAATSFNFQAVTMQASTGRYKNNVEIGTIYRNNGLAHDDDKKAAQTFPNGCADQSSHHSCDGLTRKNLICLNSGESALVVARSSNNVIDRGHFVIGTDLGAGYGSTYSIEGERDESLVTSVLDMDACFFIDMAVDRLDDWQDNPGTLNEGSNGFGLFDCDDVTIGPNVVIIGSNRMRCGIYAKRSNDVTVDPAAVVIGALVQNVELNA